MLAITHQMLNSRLMRTTLVLDDDVLDSARALAERRGVPIGKVVSELARKGLSAPEPGARRNGILLFPVQPDAGVVTPEIVCELLEGRD